MQALLDTPSFAVVGVLAQPDKPAGRGRKIHPGAVAALAAERDLPLLQPARLNAEALEQIAALQPDLLLVAAYGKLLPPDLLRLPPHGCINVHASLLPRHRGAAPIARAILASETTTGISFMLMDAGLDTGPVLRRYPLPIAADWHAGDLTGALAELSAEHLPTILAQWAAGSITAEPQEHDLAVLAPAIDKAEARLDWQLDAGQLQRCIRAFAPVPGAWCLTQNGPAGEPLRLKILASTIPPNLASDLTPPENAGQAGRIQHPAKGRLAIICGHNTLLEPTALQLPGKPVQQVRDIRNGQICQPGSALADGALLA